MRKEPFTSAKQSTQPSEQSWLDLERVAVVQVSSEEKEYPIDHALTQQGEGGWRAATKGTQTVRIAFDKPQRLSRIWLLFEDAENSRTQEFLLRCSSDGGRSFRDIVRQQWNFSPPNSVREVEDYPVELEGVTVLELIIVPDKSGGDICASLASLRLA
jgi:hypothetical protein